MNILYYSFASCGEAAVSTSHYIIQRFTECGSHIRSFTYLQCQAEIGLV